MLLHGLKHEGSESRKRTREESENHKDDNKEPQQTWQQVAQERPPHNPMNSVQVIVPWAPSQRAPALLPDREVNANDKQIEVDQTRLPSIRHLQLDSRSRNNWEHNTSHPHAYSPYPSSSFHQQSPLKATQSISPPPSPQLKATELAPANGNTFGFIETTFTNTPSVKKAHRRRPANIDKGSLYCHTCGSKNTPEWRRGPQGPATLCNACGLAYAKRLRNEEESQARLEQHQASYPAHPSHPPSHPPIAPHPSMREQYPEGTSPQFSQYPTLALSDLYHQPGLFHSLQPAGYQKLEQAPDRGQGMGGYAWTAPLSFPSRSIFRSAQNRPSGHTFHHYTPPVVVHTQPPPYLPYTTTPNDMQMPVTTTTTTTTTTSLFPFGLSPAEIPIVNAEPAQVSTPPTITTSGSLPVLTTLSTSLSDDNPTIIQNPLPYRTNPNIPPIYSVPTSSPFPVPSASPYAPTSPTPIAFTAIPSTSFSPIAIPFNSPGLYIPSVTSTPLVSIVSTPSTPSSSTSSFSTPSTPSSSSTPKSPFSPSPLASPSASPSHSPTTSPSRSHSPTLTPITTIAALSKGSSLVT